MSKVDGNTVDKAPEGLDEWVDYLAAKMCPLFDATQSAVNSLSEGAGKSVDLICAQLLLDPGAIATLLSLVNSKNKTRLSTEVSTLENAVMMIGILNSRQALKRLEIIPTPANTPALKNYVQTVVRAYHAGYQACEWAQARGDMVVKESFIAAFMCHVGEMMMQLYAFADMNKIAEVQQQTSCDYEHAQKQVLGFTFTSLSEMLNRKWHMPEIVLDCFDEDRQRSNRIKGILLAVKLARLAETSWYTKDMRAVNAEFAELFQWEYASVARKTHEIAIMSARDSYHLGEITAAVNLLSTEIEFDETDEDSAEANKEVAVKELPVAAKSSLKKSVNQTLAKLKEANYKKHEQREILNDLIFCLSKALKLKRIVYCDYDSVTKQLKPTRFDSINSKKQLEKMCIDLTHDSLFKRMLKKNQGLWLNETNKDKFWHLVPIVVKGITNTKSFYIMSFNVSHVLHGVLYADAGNACIEGLSEANYHQFKNICKLAVKCLQKLSDEE